jgi:hypothetical protein
MRDQINFEWDQSQDFAADIVELEQIKRRLGRWGINIDEDTLTTTAIKQVNKCTVFTKDHKKAWDELEYVERDWELFKTYFIEKYDEEDKYAEDTASRGGLQGINQVNEEVENGNDDELSEYLYKLKLAATENSETINQVNSKTLTVVEELTACVKTLTETVAAQQKTITSQQNTIARLSWVKTTMVEMVMEALATMHVLADRKRNAQTVDVRDTTNLRTVLNYQPTKRNARRDGNLCLKG